MEESALAMVNALNEPGEFTLHITPTSSLDFPVDRNGDATIIYSGKLYKFKKDFIRYSQLLQKLYDQDGHFENFHLSYAYDPESFNSVMKLIAGIKDVSILDHRLLSVYAIVEEMGIDNDTGFKANLEQHLLQKLEKYGAFVIQAYDISKMLKNEKIKAKCREIVNMTASEKAIVDKQVVKDKIIETEKLEAKPPQSIVDKVDEMFDSSKGAYLKKLILSILVVYSALVWGFSLLESPHKNVKFISNGAYVEGNLICEAGFEVYQDFCIPIEDDATTRAKRMIDWAQEVNGRLALENGIVRCSDDPTHKNVFSWNDVKEKLSEAHPSNMNVNLTLDESRAAFDYYFSHLRSTGIISGEHYVTSEEIMPSPTCHMKIALSSHPFVSVFVILLLALETVLMIKLFSPLMLENPKRSKLKLDDVAKKLKND